MIPIILLLASQLQSGVPDRFIEVGDRLEIVSEADPTLSVLRTVDVGGGITLPRLGRILAETRTVAELQYILQSKSPLSETFRVRVLPPANKVITYRGSIRQTGTLPISKGLRLGDVLRIGQPNEAAELSEVEIHAYNGSVSYHDVLSGDNPELRPGDTVIVPISTRPNTALIVGAVARPGTVNLGSGFTLREALGSVGGTTNHADLQNVRFSRPGQPDQILNLSSNGDLRLQRGDTVLIPQVQQIAYITLAGNVVRPGLIGLRPGMKLTEALKGVGGTGPGAGLDRIVIKRIGAGGTLRIDLRDVESGKVADPVLLPGDLIEVPFGGIRPKPEPLPKGGFPIPP